LKEKALMSSEESDLDVQINEELRARIEAGPTEEEAALASIGPADLDAQTQMSWASVDAAGNLVRGSGVWMTFKEANPSGAGKYAVVYTYPLVTARSQAYIATLGSAGGGSAIEGFITTYPHPVSPATTALVVTRDKQGNLTDSPFHILIVYRLA
jgi:hypothetical protein